MPSVDRSSLARTKPRSPPRISGPGHAPLSPASGWGYPARALYNFLKTTIVASAGHGRNSIAVFADAEPAFRSELVPQSSPSPCPGKCRWSILDLRRTLGAAHRQPSVPRRGVVSVSTRGQSSARPINTGCSLSVIRASRAPSVVPPGGVQRAGADARQKRPRSARPRRVAFAPGRRANVGLQIRSTDQMVPATASESGTRQLQYQPLHRPFRPTVSGALPSTSAVRYFERWSARGPSPTLRGPVGSKCMRTMISVPSGSITVGQLPLLAWMTIGAVWCR